MKIWVMQLHISHYMSRTEALVVSRTRIEFTGEHTVWADSEYLKSLGNEDNIYSNFIKSQGV